MIRFTLKCEDGHGFESWFASSDAFDRLISENRVNCPSCGSTAVEKAMMAPPVRPARNTSNAPKQMQADGDNAPSGDIALANAPDPEVAKAIAKLREHVEKTSDFVGNRFADEARKMHVGDTPERAIHGQASAAEARDLIEDGVPVLPLPFRPKERSN